MGEEQQSQTPDVPSRKNGLRQNMKGLYCLPVINGNQDKAFKEVLLYFSQLQHPPYSKVKVYCKEVQEILAASAGTQLRSSWQRHPVSAPSVLAMNGLLLIPTACCLYFAAGFTAHTTENKQEGVQS